MLNCKPIAVLKGQEHGFVYKYVRIAYAVGIPLKFSTDLSKRQWARFMDGEHGGFYTEQEIRRFELTGKFN